MKITSTHHHHLNDGAIYELADGRFVASHPDRDDVVVATADAAMLALAVASTFDAEIDGVPTTLVDADEAAGWHEANDGPRDYDVKAAFFAGAVPLPRTARVGDGRAAVSALFRQEVRAVDPVVTIVGGDE